jgi:integrase
MKYDILNEFKAYLQANLNKNTAKTYYSAVNKVFENIDFNDLQDVAENTILDRVKKLGSKNQVSAAKNGLKYLQMVNNHLQMPSDAQFTEISKHKRNYVKSRGKTVDFDLMQRKVNSLKNKKLKLAYRLASISGLRVSELADLEAKDIKFLENGVISVSVQHGKGDKSGQVDCLEDKYVYDNLKVFCQENENGKLFYSESYMREKANDLGIEMHDFRRAYAKLKKMDCMAAGATAYEANGAVKEGLRHSRFSTTKRYLYGRKIVTNKKIEKKANKESQEKPAREVPVFKECSLYNYELMSVVDSFDLQEPEKEALENYCGLEYEPINESLYNPDFPYTKDYEELVNIITNCIDRKTIPDDIIVYRGVPNPETFFKMNVDNMSVEQLNDRFSRHLVRHKSFMSTSIHKEIAVAFAGGRDYGLLLVIRAPKGSKGIFLNDISSHQNEKEILFQRGSFLRIDKIERGDNLVAYVSLGMQLGKGNEDHEK